MGFVSKCEFVCPSYHLAGASPLPLDMGNLLKDAPALCSFCSSVFNIVQETGIKTIPQKNKCKKAKWLSEEALQIALKRREVKSKREKERYTHLSAELQGIARKDKKAFFSDQYKEIEENNRMGMTRDLFKIPREHFMQRWAR